MGKQPIRQHKPRIKTPLKQRLAELETINAISQASARQLDFNTLVEFVGEKIRATFGVQSVFIAFLDLTTNHYHIPYWVIRDLRLPERRGFDSKTGLVGHILRTRVPLIINEDYMRVSGELGVIRVATLVSPEIPQSWLGVPIFNGEQAIGVVAVVNYEHEHAFTDATAQFLTTLAASLSNAFRNAQLYQALQNELKERTRSEENLRAVNQELNMRLEEIQLLHIKMSELLIRDPLTGLYNRRYLQETLAREIARAAREEIPLSIVMMDLDKFKLLNDTYGHQAGDLTLQKLGELLLAYTRRSDVACRYGGEEFVSLMPGASLTDAAERAEDIRGAMENLRIAFGSMEIGCTLSLGVAGFPSHGKTGDEIIATADAMLYTAKHSGRNRVMIAPASAR